MLRIATWNIDQGRHYTQVLSTLQTLNADVLLLQEVDSGTARTAGHDVPKALAKQLELSAAFGIEFEKLSQETGHPAYTVKLRFHGYRFWTQEFSGSSTSPASGNPAPGSRRPFLCCSGGWGAVLP